MDLDKPEIHQINVSKAHTVYLFCLILTGSSGPSEGINQEQTNHIRLLNYSLKTILKLKMGHLGHRSICLPVIFFHPVIVQEDWLFGKVIIKLTRSNFSNQKLELCFGAPFSF